MRTLNGTIDVRPNNSFNRSGIACLSSRTCRTIQLIAAALIRALGATEITTRMSSHNHRADKAPHHPPKVYIYAIFVGFLTATLLHWIRDAFAPINLLITFIFPLLIFAVLGAIFGYLWPKPARAMEWGWWLAISFIISSMGILMFKGVNLLEYLTSAWPMLSIILLNSFVGAWIGTRLFMKRRGSSSSNV